MPGLMQMNNRQENAKNSQKALKELVKYIRPFLVPFVLAILLSIAGVICTILTPNWMGDMTTLMSDALTSLAKDGFWTNINTDSVFLIGIKLLIVIIISALCSLATGLILTFITLKISRKMRNDLEVKINTIPLSYYSKNTNGDILSRITNDVDTIIESLSNSVSSLVSGCFQILGCLIMMFVTQWIMAVAAVVASLLGFALMFIIMGKSQKYFTIRQEALGKLNGYVEEMYGGHEVVRVSGADKSVKAKFVGYNEKVKKANFMSQMLSGMMPSLMTFVGNLGYVVVCVVGAIGVIKGWFGFGIIASFILYVRLFTSPLSTISQGASQMQSCLAASERVFNFLNEPNLSDDSSCDKKLTNVQGSVAFKNVKFAYEDEPSHIVINNFSSQVKPGQKVAIVGPTGAGKTTLVNLLMRFYEPISGSISIDGVSTEEMKRSDVHSLFGMVLQDSWLFEGSVRENLVFNKTGVSDETINKALKACGLADFVNTLPKGLDTILDESTSLSTGQKQLFTIARAMIQNNPMLILDEATSNVDTRTEILIQNAMDELTKKRTSFVIAHRLSTIKNADLILVINHGDIVEQGSHDELIKQGGFYAKLYESQFANGGGSDIDTLASLATAK